MQNILLGIAATNTPRQANILLIDPKQGGDYFQFEDLPHLSGGVIVDDQQAIQRLETLVQEMDDRYKRLKVAEANNITNTATRNWGYMRGVLCACCCDFFFPRIRSLPHFSRQKRPSSALMTVIVHVPVFNWRKVHVGHVWQGGFSSADLR